MRFYQGPEPRWTSTNPSVTFFGNRALGDAESKVICYPSRKLADVKWGWNSGRSSKGRTRAFGAWNPGSNPGLPAIAQWLWHPRRGLLALEENPEICLKFLGPPTFTGLSEAFKGVALLGSKNQSECLSATT